MAAVLGDIERGSDGRERRAPLMSANLMWIVAVAAIAVAGWFLPLERYLSPRQGVGYWLGVAGGSAMLLLLIYPLRKRWRVLSFVGTARIWFQIHMVLGVLGPMLILYHCLYRFGAANSNVALICMLVVSGSGIMGRYLYARIHHGLYGRLATLAEFRAESERLKGETAGVARLLPELAPRLDASEARIGRKILLIPQPLTASFWYRYERARILRYVDSAIRAASQSSDTIRVHARSLEQSTRRYVDDRLAAARRVAEYESCAKLFGLWHVLHIPLFFMLLAATIVHVIAVHVY